MRASNRIRKLARGFLGSLLTFSPSLALPAPCCGGHAALPSLITGFESFRLNSSFSYNSAVGDAPAEGLAIFRDADGQLPTELLQISGSARVGRRFQLGASLNLSPSSGEIGDTDVTAGWEILPREDLTNLTPQLILFSQTTAPTGRSIYQSDPHVGTTPGSDVTGQGFWRTGVGIVATTTYQKWDAFGLLRVSRSFAGSFAEPAKSVHKNLYVEPGISSDASLGLGYSISGEWRLGLAAQAATAEGMKITRDGTTDKTGASLVWPVSLQVTYFKSEQSTLSLTYLDETLLGPVRNTVLSRSANLLYSYRWTAGG